MPFDTVLLDHTLKVSLKFTIRQKSFLAMCIAIIFVTAEAVVCISKTKEKVNIGKTTEK
jgi:hypothetical protein